MQTLLAALPVHLNCIAAKQRKHEKCFWLAFCLYPEALACAEAGFAGCCAAIFRCPTGLCCEVYNLWGGHQRCFCFDHCSTLSLPECSRF